METHSFEEHIQPLISKYCYSCHGEGKKLRGDLDLTPYQKDTQVFEERDEWLYILEQIETEEMPTKEPLPTDEERALMVNWIHQRLNDIDWSQIREAGHVTIPRLNKREYSNTMRDLFGFDTYAGEALSADGEGQNGFTTDRDNLFITPSEMEKYFQAANQAIDAAIANEARPVTKRFESEKMFMTERARVVNVEGVVGYEINRGQMTLYDSYDFPYSGYYQFSVRALPTVVDTGVLRLRVDNKPSGNYLFKGKRSTVETVSAYINKGTHQIAFNFERSLLPPKLRKQYSRERKVGTTLVDWVEVVGPIRPEQAPKDSPVFFIRPGGSVSAEQAARKIVNRFVQRAFRRPIRESETERYLSLFQLATAQGESFAPSIKLALSAVLVSPNFLFRHELAPQADFTGEFALNDYQIASRLSYFLWMSMPDSELLKLAKEKKLREPEVLRVQVRRMLKNPKSRSFTSAFLGEWLGYQSVGESVIPDRRTFPDFDAKLAKAMKNETILTFEHLLKNNHSLPQLIDTKAAFVNERLAEHYEIKGVEGSQMRPIAIQDPNRGGLLGMASVLTATSSPTRTSPVVRGKWVLEALLGERVPEPPDDAGELSAGAGRNKGKTLREELEIHRNNPDCRSCHEKIDPIGFGLENFDGIGRFRTQENGKAIDNTGVIEGHQFSGTAQLKKWLLSERRDEFLNNVAERMLSFALGRELETFDEGPLLKIQKNLAENNWGALSLIEEVVLSHPFLHQNNQRPQLNY